MSRLLERFPEEVRRILAKYPPGEERSAVMPLLHLAQAEEGHIEGPMVEEIASITGISITDVASLLGFYTLFHEEAGGRYRIQVCNDLPCALRGSGKFLEAVCSILGIQPGETTPDGVFTLEEVKCLAACNHAPVFQVQGDGELVYHENQTEETVRIIIDELRRKAAGDEGRAEP